MGRTISNNNKLKVLFVYPNIMMSALMPTSIGILSAVLKQEGVEVDLFDSTFYKTQEVSTNERKVQLLQVKPFDFGERGIKPKETDMLEDFRRKVEEFQPDLLAVSMVEDTYNIGLSMLDKVSDIRPLTIAGGVFPTAAPEVVLQSGLVDMVCVGDGEGPLRELCLKLAAGEDHTGIKGLWVKMDGEIFRNGLMNADELDSLPVPEFDIFDKESFYRPMAGKVYRMTGVETIRGCPYSCTFCNSPAKALIYREQNCGNYLRRKSVDRVQRELEHLIKTWDIEYIYFVADTFLAVPDEEFREFAEMYNDFRLPFWMNTRPETLTVERIELLEKMNCHRMNVGVEHGNEDFRKSLLKRQISNRKIIDSFKLLEGSGIFAVANFIIGFPDETRELIFDSIRLCREISPYVGSVSSFIFAPYHGTPLRKLCVDKGYIKGNEIVSIDTTRDSMLNMPQISSDELRGLARTFPLYVKLPEDQYSKIKLAEKEDKEGERVFEELAKKYREEILS